MTVVTRLWYYTVVISAKRAVLFPLARRALSAGAPLGADFPPPPRVGGVDRVLVVGAGLAGLGTATALRQQGHAGPLTLVGAEPRPPYDRPPLSKAVMLGEADDSDPRGRLGRAGGDPLLGRRATGLREGVLETDAGELAGTAW